LRLGQENVSLPSLSPLSRSGLLLRGALPSPVNIPPPVTAVVDFKKSLHFILPSPVRQPGSFRRQTLN
jgi:hypothetical protein